MKPNLFRELTAALLVAGLLLQSATAAAPGWWGERGVINLQKAADDFAVLNQGQLKSLAAKAWLQMELALPGGAGDGLNQLISGWRVRKPQTDDYATVNIGQLKAVVRPFYERLSSAGLASLPAWMTQSGASSADDYAAANLGQAKALFSFVIPQALGLAPQRLSGNGITGGSFPSNHPWGSGRPPPAPAAAAQAGLPMSNDSEVATTPASPTDYGDLATSYIVAETKSAHGGVSRTLGGGGWEGSGSAYCWNSGEFRSGLQSSGALTSALADLTDLEAGGTPGYNWSLFSGYSATRYEGQVVGEDWNGGQVQFRLYGGGAPTAPPRQAWLKIERTIYNQNDFVGRTVEFQPYLIAPTAASATTLSIVSQHWGADGESEYASVSLILPQVIQINDGDIDGDDIPDFADGFNAVYPVPADEPEVPETASLFGVARGASGHPDERVRFLYSASDPAAVDVQTAADGTTTYTPAPGALRVWRSNIFEWYAVSRNPQSVSAGGDYVPPGEWFNAAELGSAHVESVALSQQPYDQVVDVEVDPDGDGPEGPYIAHRYVFSSVGLHLEKVENGVIGGRARRMQPSLPNPTITLGNVSVINARPAPDGSGLLANIQFTGTVRSAVCDLTPGEETGAIHQAYASVNDTPLPQSVVSLQVAKGDTPVGQDRPYPYQGTFSHTLTDVPVTEGKNTLGLMVSDPLYHLSGTAEVGFDIEAAPPGGEGGAYASSTTVQLELPVPGSTLAEDEARLSIEADDTVLLDRLLLRRQAGGTLYVSEDGQRTFQFTQPPALTPGTAEALHGYITLPQSGWQSAAFSPMTETEAASGVFTWSATEEYGGYWGWSASVAAVEQPVASGAGDFNPYTVRLMGPQALLEQVRRIHIGGHALPVVTQNGEFRVADALHPDQPVTLAGLPVVARQPPPIPEEGTASPGLVELGIGEEWEAQDIPEETHDAMEAAMSRRLAQVGDGADFKRRILRHISTGFTDQLTPSFYGGFLVGFLDNPWSNGKDCCSTLLGIGTKVAEVAWLISPLGMAWEFSFGDAYQGEIKAAVNTSRKVGAALGTAYDFAKEWGEPVCTFLGNLMEQGTDAVAMALRGEIPQRHKMGPELQVALEVITQLILMADDAWQGIGAYERGYWQGYIAFEVAAVVVAAILSAPAGGSGGAAVLARHTPKVTRILRYLEQLLSRFDDLPGIGKLVAKIRGFMADAQKAGNFCFVAGTPVLTLRGHIPIEQVKAGDYVWSRDDETGEWGWRPVLKTFVTHPDALVHVCYEAVGGEVDVAASDGLGLMRQAASTSANAEAEIVGTAGHPFHVRRAGLAAAFLAASALQAGDLLTLADGRDAAVTEVKVEQAAAGALFTTYNFTVADHHTYFAGILPVWVHNTGIDACSFLDREVGRILRKYGLDWNSSAGQRADILAKELGDVIAKLSSRVNPNTGLHKPLPERLIRLAMAKICQAEYKDFGTKHNNLNAFKSVQWWDDLFESSGLRKGSVPITSGVKQHLLQNHTHHLVEDWMLKVLGTSPPGQKRMDVPGVVMRGYDNGQPGLGPFHNQKDTGLSVALGKLRRKKLLPEDMLSEFKNILISAEFKDMNLWPAAREFLLKDLPSANHWWVPAP